MTTQTLIDIWNFIKAHQAVAITIVAAIPSIITALTPYPKLKGVASALSFVLDLASIFTHSDSQGTLKLPIVQVSAPPAGQTATMPQGVVGGAGIGAAVLAMALVGPGCAFLKGIATPSETCGVDAILAVFANMSVADVVGDIGAGLSCEVKAIVAYEQSQLGKTADAGIAASVADAGVNTVDAGTIQTPPTSTDIVLKAIAPAHKTVNHTKILTLGQQYLATHK